MLRYTHDTSRRNFFFVRWKQGRVRRSEAPYDRNRRHVAGGKQLCTVTNYDYFLAKNSCAPRYFSGTPPQETYLYTYGYWCSQITYRTFVSEIGRLRKGVARVVGVVRRVRLAYPIFCCHRWETPLPPHYPDSCYG